MPMELMTTLASISGWLIVASSIFWVWLKFLSGPNWTESIRTWLENEAWSDAYASMLGLLSNRLDALFGQDRWGVRAFGVCYIFAIAYAVLWFFISMYLSGGEDVSGRSIAIGFVLSVPLGFLAYRMSRFTQEQHAVSSTLHSDQPPALGMQEYISYFCIGAASGAAPALVPFADPNSVAVAGAIAGACAIVSASILAGARAGITVSAGLVASVLLGANSIVIVLFPLINALFDFPSWAVSRWFLSRLGKDATEPVLWLRGAKIAVHIFFDIGFALFMLTAFAVCLSMMWNGSPWSPTSLYNDPFSAEGSGLSVMLLSTLVPTALHLFCAVFAILPALPVGHRWIASWIPPKEQLADFEKFETGDRMIVAAWLTAWSVVSLIIVWGLFLGGTRLLDAIWGTGPEGRNFWQVMLDAAHGLQQWTGYSLF